MKTLFPKNERQATKRFQRKRRFRDNEKELLRLQREYFRLRQVSYSAPLIKLDRPYQRGWIRRFKLTDRANRRVDREELLQVLKIVDRIQYCWRGTFDLPRRRKGKRRSYSHKLWRPCFSSLLDPKVPEILLNHFVLPCGLTVHSRDNLRDWIQRRWNSRTDVICPQHFESTIQPLMITHQRANLPEVDALLDEISAFLGRDGRWKKLHRLQCSRSLWRKYWKKHAGTAKRSKLRNFLDAEEIHNARIEFNASQPPPLLDHSPTDETTEGTTKIVSFDFPELSFSTHQRTAA